MCNPTNGIPSVVRCEDTTPFAPPCRSSASKRPVCRLPASTLGIRSGISVNEDCRFTRAERALRQWMALGRRILVMTLPLVLTHCGVDGVHRREQLLSAAREQRFTSGRLAGTRVWRACAPDNGTGLVSRDRCDSLPNARTRGYRRIARATAEARSRLRPDSSAAARHELALVELLWHQERSATLDDAVVRMQEAHRASPEDPDILNDLSVVYLALGERDHQLSPVLRALEAAGQALALDSTHVPALFNRALILDRLYLVATARHAWMRYLAREHDAAWRREAAAHLKLGTDTVQFEPEAGVVRLMQAPHDSHVVSLVARGAADRGRMIGFRLLGQWGAAIAGGDSARAVELLMLAQAVAAAQTSLSVDVSLAEATAFAARPSHDGASQRALAVAHAQFGVGVRRFFESGAAVAQLDSAERGFRALGSPTARWAAFFLGASYVNLGRYEDGDRVLRAVLDGARPGEPALAGKAMLGLGLSQLRRGNYEPALEFYRLAAPFVERAHEPETAGHAAYLATEGLVLSGQALDAQEEAYRGLRILSRFRRSNSLNNHLSRVAGIARDAGLHRAALELSEEGLEVARGVGKPDVLALALCARARDLSAVGREAEAGASLRAAAGWADSMPRAPLQNRIRAAVLLARGEIMRNSDPRGALPLLAAAVDSFRRFQTDRNLPEALFQATLAANSAGEPGRAHRWIREAVRATERQQSVFRQTAGRATFAELVERVSDQMISLELSEGRADSAFFYLERARVAAWPPGTLAARRPLTPGQLRTRLPAEMLVVEYALIGDRVAVWSVSRDGWRAHVLAVSRDSIRRLVARLPDELSGAVADSTPALAQLYDLLLRPLGNVLARARRVVIVPDRELHGVPFSALRNREDGRYAIEWREFSTVPSAAFLFAVLASPAQRGNGRAPLVIGEPALSLAAAARLGRLPGAAREAARVARLYPHSTHLAGAAADRARVLEMLPRASMMHFAGHAVFDAERPEQSYLALASRDSSDARLLAGEIGRLRPSNLGLVVLSACSTMNPRPSRSGGVAGLAYSFLQAGALATVSTLWDVSDSDMTELLVTFHQELRQGRAPASALRNAQLRALQSASPVTRAPLTWAALTYTGS